MKTRFAAALSLSAVLSIAGCAAPSLTSPSSPQGASSKKAETSTNPASADGGNLIGTGGGNLATGSGSAGKPASAPSAAASTAPSGSASRGDEGLVSNNAGGLIGKDAAEGAPGMSPPMEPGGAAVAPLPNQEALKAGAVDDNAKYKDYMEYVGEFGAAGGANAPRTLDVSERHVIRVVDANGKGVSNAAVTIKSGEAVVAEAKTYADGRTLFHPSAYPGLDGAQGSYTVSVTKGAETASKAFEGSTTTDWEVALAAGVEKPAAKLDLSIVLDTTGSMGGEISKFKQTISSIATRLQGLPQQPSVRFGLVAYKDQGEQYVSKVAAPFTPEIATFQSALNMLSPGGGGDKPEDLEAALSDTVNKLAWDDGEAVRLTFVVTDASAHTNYDQSTPYTDSMQIAAKKGIKLYAIGASSLEPAGEFQLRQLAQWTMAKYLFVTRGGDEATGGGGTASATVDAFKEGRLDDIVVDIAKGELDKLGK